MAKHQPESVDWPDITTASQVRHVAQLAWDEGRTTCRNASRLCLNSGHIRSTSPQLGRIRLECRRNKPETCRSRSGFSQMCLNWGQRLPNLAGLDQIWATCDRIEAKSGQLRQDPASGRRVCGRCCGRTDIGAKSDKLCDDIDQFRGAISDEFGPFLAGADQIRVCSTYFG